MKVLKKIGVALALCSLPLSGVYPPDSFSAVSEKTIQIHDKTNELVDLVTDYYITDKSPSSDSSGLNSFLEKLNETQLETFKRSFSYGFPELSNNGGEVNLSVSVKSINLLVAAVQSADLELVKLVVENFDVPDLDATDDSGSGSPLWNAVCSADGTSERQDEEAEKIVDYLLSLGANPYTENGKGYIPCLYRGLEPSHSRMKLKETFEKYGYSITDWAS